MQNKKVCSVVLAISLLASSLGSFGVTSVKESRASEKKDEYIVQADNQTVYEQLLSGMEGKDCEVVKHTEEDEAYLEENQAVVLSLTKSEAAELNEEQGITVEKDATVRGSSQQDDGLIYAEPEEIDIDSLPVEDEYTADATEFEPRKDVTDPDEVDEVVPWNISCVAGTPHENRYKGKKVKVAVLDSGIDMHDELYTKQWIDFSDKVNGYKPTDNSGHGTTVAGPIAARISGFGMEGIASEAELYSVKVLDKENTASVSTIVKALEWCIQNDMDIVNMSFGMDSYSEILADAVKKAYDNNILMVAAAGNDVKQIQYPARFPEVLSVGSINSKLETSEFSDNSQTDLVAPGEDVQSIAFLGSYTRGSGTSLAAAHVAGVAAAVKSADTSLSASQLMGILKESAISLGDDGKLVNYENAVALAEDKDNLPTVTKEDVAEIVEEKTADEECYVKGSWAKTFWETQTHKDMINGLDIALFKGNTSEKIRHRNITARAAYNADDYDYLSASDEGNYGRDDNGNILDKTAPRMYSPYHAKSEYTLSEVSQHIMFLYELVRRSIVLNSPLSLDVNNYTGAGYYGFAISEKMKKRIIADLKKMHKDMDSKEGIFVNDDTLEQGYMVLGIFLHLIQDLQAHRARFYSYMVFSGSSGEIYTEDTFVGSISGSRINGNNLAGPNKIYALKIAFQNSNAIPMVNLKDYLKPKITISCTETACTSSQAYEDNPYFFSDRFSTAKSFSSRYMSEMNVDTGNQSTRTTYYTASSVPLI